MMDYAARNRDQLLYNIYKMGMNSIDRGSRDYWALSPSKIEEMNRLIAEGQKIKLLNLLLQMKNHIGQVVRVRLKIL